MRIEMDIQGARELDQMLAQMPVTVARRTAVNALRAGARVIRDEARRRAPVGPEGFTRKAGYAGTAAGSGALRRAIKVRTDVYKGGTERRVVVVVSNKRAGINPHWVEYGIGHRRFAKNGGLLTFVIDGRWIRKRSVAGIKENPFMRSAVAAKFTQTVEEVAAVLGVQIEKEALRLGRP